MRVLSLGGWRNWTVTAAACLLAAGCSSVETRNQVLESQIPVCTPTPRELNKVSLPTYVIEPPDILLVDAVKVIPRPPQKIEPLDLLNIVVVGNLQDQPIAGPYAVEADGMVNLGFSYGSVKVAGLSLQEARDAIRTHLEQFLAAPEVYVALASSAGEQQIAGEHLVGPDGTVNLGTYGLVRVTGMTVEQAKFAIEEHLEAYLEDPEVSVSVFSYNSKVYYIVTQGAGQGDQLLRVPCTGNETVLDAISQVSGLSPVSSKTIWIARPTPDGAQCQQILPVNWNAIVMAGDTATNWQVMPGDRVFIAQDRMITLGNLVNKVIGPVERLFGFSLLGTQTIQSFNRFPDGSFGGSNNPFGN